MELDKASFEAWFGLGNCFFDLEQYEDALHCLEQAHRLRPEDEQVLIGQGSSLANLGRFQEALACFEMALAIAPQDETAETYRDACLKYLDGDPAH